MKKLWSMLAILAALFIVSCGDDYDDTAIKNQINDLENRVANLEQLCQQMNTNISSMQTILNALQERDYITSVTPIKEGDAVIGYTINFAINDPITIYHGKNGADGKDGYVPVIGVAKFEDDGLYYWTLDGEWLTDAEGNKVRAQGLDGGTGDGGSEGSAGKDGITPQLKIKLNYWYISYDN
jgi:tetrahydromethanopterin S-methyltransferase subunit B